MGRVSLILLLLIATGLNLTIAMVRSRPTRDQPNVIMIVVDALRPDHLGTYGYPRNTSPHIDKIASAGIRFDLAISQSTLTKTSIASLFTGLYPYRHGVYSGNRLTEDGRPVSDTLNSSHTTLAERLRSEGYLTAAWLQQSQLKSNSGYSRGFMFYRENSRDIRTIHRRFQRWLSRVRSTAPLFVYLHYIDLHDPYLPNPPFDTLFGEGGTIYQKLDLHHWKATLRDVRTGKLKLTRKDIDQLEALYDGQISFIDQEIGKLWDALERQGQLRNSVVILTSDHGDAFMEHGFISHSVQPYDELINVPLIMRLPEEVTEAQRSVPAQVRLIDVMPTILDLAGADAPADLDGRSLGRLLVGKTGEPADSSVSEPIAISEVEVQTGEGTQFFVSIRSREQKYLASLSDPPELYDLVNDPGEQVNLMPVSPERTEIYRHIVQRILEAREDLGAGQISLDEQTIEQLKALGYLE